MDDRVVAMLGGSPMTLPLRGRSSGRSPPHSAARWGSPVGAASREGVGGGVRRSISPPYAPSYVLASASSPSTSSVAPAPGGSAEHPSNDGEESRSDDVDEVRCERNDFRKKSRCPVALPLFFLLFPFPFFSLFSDPDHRPSPSSPPKHRHHQQKKTKKQHTHYSHRAPWLRAAVLGANDGLVSTASLMLGVGGGTESLRALVLAGVAGLVAGALSMAVGEYISVSSQRDAEEVREERAGGKREREREREKRGRGGKKKKKKR